MLPLPHINGHSMMPLGTQQDIYKALPLTQVEENLSNKVLPDSSGQGFRMVLRMEVGNLLGELPPPPSGWLSVQFCAPPQGAGVPLSLV